MAKSRKKISPSESAERIICRNRRATYDYAIEERHEAGLVLVGSEVKSLRAGKASIAEAYAYLHEGELYLVGAHIPEYPWSNRLNHEPTRRRKMLMNRKEIDKLSVRIIERGYSLVPMALYFKNGRAKLEIGLGKGKKHYDKRHAIRERDAKRTEMD